MKDTEPLVSLAALLIFAPRGLSFEISTPHPPQDTALGEQPQLPKAAAQPQGVVERMGVPQPAHPAAVPGASLPLCCAFVPRAGWGEWAGFQLSFCKVGDFFLTESAGNFSHVVK